MLGFNRNVLDAFDVMVDDSEFEPCAGETSPADGMPWSSPDTSNQTCKFALNFAEGGRRAAQVPSNQGKNPFSYFLNQAVKQQLSCSAVCVGAGMRCLGYTNVSLHHARACACAQAVCADCLPPGLRR